MPSSLVLISHMLQYPYHCCTERNTVPFAQFQSVVRRLKKRYKDWKYFEPFVNCAQYHRQLAENFNESKSQPSLQQTKLLDIYKAYWMGKSSDQMKLHKMHYAVTEFNCDGLRT